MPAKALLSEAVMLECARGGNRPTAGCVQLVFSDPLQEALRFRSQKTQHPSLLETVGFPGASGGRRLGLGPHAKNGPLCMEKSTNAGGLKGAEKPSPSDLDVAAEQLTWAIPGIHFPRNLNNFGHVANRQPVISANF